jgi:hypothetical protein
MIFIVIMHDQSASVDCPDCAGMGKVRDRPKVRREGLLSEKKNWRSLL